jgi:hypothetical protein
MCKNGKRLVVAGEGLSQGGPDAGRCWVLDVGCGVELLDVRLRLLKR